MPKKIELPASKREVALYYQPTLTNVKCPSRHNQYQHTDGNIVSLTHGSPFNRFVSLMGNRIGQLCTDNVGGFNDHIASQYTVIVLSNTGMGASDVAEKIEARLYGKPVQLAVQADSNMMLALDLVMRGDLRGAAKLYDRNPSHAPSVYQAARTRIDGGYETTEAIALLNRYLRFDAAV